MFVFRVLGGFAQAVLLVLVANPAWAQLPLSLHEAQRLALARSQELSAQDAAAARAREMGVAAGQLPDPVLKIGIDNLPVNGAGRFSASRDFMTMRRVGVMQELTSADKRRLRSERMERDGDRIQAQRAEAAAAIQRDTALAWIERHRAQLVADLVQRQLNRAQLEVQAAEIGYGTGRGSQADIFGARGAVAKLLDQLRLAQQQEQAARLMLARWVGAEQAQRPLGKPPDWQRTTVSPPTQEESLRRLPQLAAVAAEVRAAETEVRQAQANTRPDWTVEAMYSQRGSAYSDMVSIGIAIPLQVDRGNRQDREVAAKVAALTQARARLEEAVRVEQARVQVLAHEWNAGKERAARLTAELLPSARLRTESALTAYQTGAGELSGVLAARREELDAAMQVLALEMEVARLWAQLNHLNPESAMPRMGKEQP